MHTDNIDGLPYDPAVWLSRADVLIRCGFPELALGDCYKAKLLMRERTWEGDQEMKRNAFYLTIQALCLCGCMMDALDEANSAEDLGAVADILKTHMPDNSLPYRQHIHSLTGIDRQEAERSGYLRLVAYPWMDLAPRDPPVLKESVRQFLGSACQLYKSPIRAKMDGDGTDVLGVRATSDLQKGDIALVAQANADSGRCCCWAGTALAETPSQISQQAASQDRLLLQVLNKCLTKRPVTDPLEHPIVAQLCVPYSPFNYIPFNYQKSIVRPITMIESLGVDIFADLDYDTWILLTIQHRLRNNRIALTGLSGRPCHLLSQLYAFFNHSCDPNVTSETDSEGGTTLVMKATRSIRSGDELFVSYLGQQSLAITMEIRRAELWPWFGCLCQCPKCIKEEKQSFGNLDADPREL